MNQDDLPTLVASAFSSHPINLVGEVGLETLIPRKIKSAKIDGNLIASNSVTLKEVPMARRLVQVFIADPNENVPLDRALLYSGPQQFTDATDQELFYEIDMKSILDKYNKDRVTFIDKKVKERTEHLEPAKIRDLKMTIVTIATF